MLLGEDGQSIADFEADLENLFKAWNRMSSGTYFPPAVPAVEIPKQHGGGTRMLGIPVHLVASGDAVQTLGACLLLPSGSQSLMRTASGWIAL